MADDGKISGRGSPWLRGVVCGLMTTPRRPRHTIPYLIPDAWANAFLIGDRHRRHSRGGGTLRHRMDPHALHGTALPALGDSGHRGRRPRAGDGRGNRLA
jgi:hypothetical protein